MLIKAYGSAVHGINATIITIEVNITYGIRKECAAYDLPLALGILAASKQLRADLHSEYLVVSELSRDGTVQNVRGVLPMALRANEEGFRGIILPRGNARDVAL